MRPFLLAALVLVVAATLLSRVPARADGEGAPPAPAGGAVAARLEDAEAEAKALRAEVRYLLAREAAISKYLAALSAGASSALDNAVVVARREGFEMAAIPSPSRTALLGGLEGLSRELRTNPPVATNADRALLREAEDLRKSAAK